MNVKKGTNYRGEGGKEKDKEGKEERTVWKEDKKSMEEKNNG
jgi:hypothetical protein